jgi:hypothetical protein
MNAKKNSDRWLTSTEAKKELRISSCGLMHNRDAVKLRFQKQGNAFFYAKEDVERMRRDKSSSG